MTQAALSLLALSLLSSRPAVFVGDDGHTALIPQHDEFTRRRACIRPKILI